MSTTIESHRLPLPRGVKPDPGTVRDLISPWVDPKTGRIRPGSTQQAYQTVADHYARSSFWARDQIPSTLKPTQSELLEIGRAALAEKRRLKRLEEEVALPDPSTPEAQKRPSTVYQQRALKRLPVAAAPLVDPRGELVDYDETRSARSPEVLDLDLDASSRAFLEEFRLKEAEEFITLLRRTDPNLRAVAGAVERLFERTREILNRLIESFSQRILDAGPTLVELQSEYREDVRLRDARIAELEAYNRLLEEEVAQLSFRLRQARTLLQESFERVGG